MAASFVDRATRVRASEEGEQVNASRAESSEFTLHPRRLQSTAQLPCFFSLCRRPSSASCVLLLDTSGHSYVLDAVLSRSIIM